MPSACLVALVVRAPRSLPAPASAAASRAAGVGSGGISSDDPDAVVKLKAELVEIEARIVRENAANKAIRKGDWDGVAAAVGPELAAKESAEIAVIEAFLPQQLDDSAIEAAVAGAIAETGAAGIKDMGKVMAALRAKHAAALDMAKAGPIVKAKLSA